jgi:protein-tyrosine phosphatase
LLTGEGDMLLPSGKKAENANVRNSQLPDLNNMTANDMRELLKWIDTNYETMKSIVDALNK